MLWQEKFCKTLSPHSCLFQIKTHVMEASMNTSKTAKEVYQDERKIILASRKQKARLGEEHKEVENVDDVDFVGLAFSGGGIRSATFNLGVLKALADLGLLKHIDYLSTVSGGGYIGSWLTAYLHHDSGETVDEIIAKACKDIDESLTKNDQKSSAWRKDRPMWFLRSYSNYLTPNVSMFSADTWTVVSTYLRNWILNLTLLFFFFTLLLLLVHFLEIIGIQLITGEGIGWGKSASLLSLLGAGYCAFESVSKPTSDKGLPMVCLILIVIFAFAGSFTLLNLCLETITPFISHAVIWMPPALIIAVMLVVIFYIGFRSQYMEDQEMEWFSRLGAWLWIFIVSWSVIFAVVFYSPLLPKYIDSLWVKSGISIAWFLQSVLGLLAANSTKTSASVNKKTSNKALEIFLKVSPYIFVLGIFVAIACLLTKLFYSDCQFDYFYCLNNLSTFNTSNIYYAIIVCLLATVVLGFFLDVNKLSIHYFYRNRLIRCYLGAARKSERKYDFSGFDEKDNFELSELLKQDNEKNEYVNGPYPIINGTLNLVAGKELAWQQRKASSFIFTPKYCGYTLREKHCYQPSKDYKTNKHNKHRGGVTLGTALAISGAAASPNSGYHSSPVMSFLMTIFNVRLGQWLPNPKFNETKEMMPLVYLLSELFGWTNEEKDFVYLSDGGHFENLGIYELVRRKCRFILASDAEQDGQFAFEGLGNAIEKCRVDLGVNIDIDIEQIRPTTDNKNKWHCAAGKIKYTNDSKDDGILIYIKSSLTGDESTDILHYSLQSPDFPHETTADQWFTESQFESYRQLGEHICRETIGLVAKETPIKDIKDIFEKLENRWYSPLVDVATFIKHTKTLGKLFDHIRQDKQLAFLDAELYSTNWNAIVSGQLQLTLPETNKSHPASYEEFHHAFYFCNSLIQLMEDVFLDLNFDVGKYCEHPHNKGWHELFKQWAKSDTLKKTWAITGSTYGERFQSFAKDTLKFPAPTNPN